MVKKLIYISLLLLFGTSCQKVNHSKYLGPETQYQINKLINGKEEVFDTLTLKQVPSYRFYFLFKNVIEYNYKNETKTSSLGELTGATIEENTFGFHPPRNDLYTFLAIIPFPEISLPPVVGNSAVGEMTIVKNNSFPSLNGKVINQELLVTSKKDTLIQGKLTSVFVQHGKNTNLIKEEGQFLCEYHFEQNYGYVYLKFLKPNGNGLVWRKIIN